jgi:hypothetical protein
MSEDHLLESIPRGDAAHAHRESVARRIDAKELGS